MHCNPLPRICHRLSFLQEYCEKRGKGLPMYFNLPICNNMTSISTRFRRTDDTMPFLRYMQRSYNTNALAVLLREPRQNGSFCLKTETVLFSNSSTLCVKFFSAFSQCVIAKLKSCPAIMIIVSHEAYVITHGGF